MDSGCVEISDPTVFTVKLTMNNALHKEVQVAEGAPVMVSLPPGLLAISEVDVPPGYVAQSWSGINVTGSFQWSAVNRTQLVSSGL